MNLPHDPEGDALVVPLNVLVGGQASPRDSGSQNRRASSAALTGKARGPALVKNAVPEPYTEQGRRTLSNFYERQGRSVTARVGSGAEEWWDEERWDEELTTDIQRLALLISTYIGEETTSSLGFPASEYSVEQTEEFLLAVSERVARETNATTRDQIAEALDTLEPDERLAGVEHVFAIASESRAETGAVSLGTLFAGFAAVEAAKQRVGDQATKTWVVTSGNPRASHAAMDGETVPLNENFSNGLPWPGSVEGGPDETSGCQCELQINIP